MKPVNVRFAGFGGQGIALASVVLGRAAAVEGKHVIQTQSYGPEARGGASKGEVRISDQPIYYPGVTKPDVLVAMSAVAYNQYAGDAKTVLVNSTVGAPKGYTIPATPIAIELGKHVVANMVMVGAVGGLTSIVSKESLERSIIALVPRGLRVVNLRAFRRGWEIGESLQAGDKPTKKELQAGDK